MGAEGWRRLSVSEIAEINPRRPIRSGETVPFVEMAAVRTDLPHVDYLGEREAMGSGSRFTNGDTLFARITPCAENGKASFVNYLPDSSVGMGSTEFIVLGPRRNLIEPKYLYWLARSDLVRKHATANMVGTSGRQRVPTWVFDEITVPVPPLGKQRWISEILDSVDEAILATRAVIEQTRKVKWGLLQDLLARGIGHTRFKQSEIGEVPEGWEVASLGEVLRGIVPGRSPLASSESARPSEAGVLKVSSVGFGEFYPNENKALPEDFPMEERFRVRGGDLLITRANTKELVGAACVVPTGDYNLMLCDKTLRLDLLGDRISPEFACAVLLSGQVREFLQDNASGTSGSMKNISQELIRRIQLPLPPVEEQLRIADVVLAIDEVVRQDVRSLAQIEAIRRGLIDDLVTGRIRANIGA